MCLLNLSFYISVTLMSVAVTAYIVKTDSYPFVDRAAWGALEPKNVKPLQTPAPYVVIHHTYIPGACFTVEDCSKSMRSMQNYHMGLGWGDIGYNFCVGTEGSAFEGRGWSTVGAHAGRANNFSIGICLIGDWREEFPPPLTLQTTKDLISDGVSRGAISPDYKLIGHMQAMPTECPGTKLMAEIETWSNYQPGHVDFP